MNWFADYLFNRSQFVVYHGQNSDHCKVTCGVPQGSIHGPLLFIIFANDIVDHVKHSSLIKYADDTVLYTPGKDIIIIENKLSKDMSSLAAWFNENELILNLKKGKTEAMLFGSSKRLSTVKKSLEVKFNNETIKVTTSYKYLGVELDPALTLNQHFNNSYKKSTGRLHLLEKLRSQLDNKSAALIYNSMVLPIITYCCLISLHSTRTQINKLTSIDNRARNIVNREQANIVNITSINSFKQRQACKFVRKCIDNNICENFHQYFTKINHGKHTRNNEFSLKLPAVRTEFAKKSTFFMAAQIYNKLPLDIRKIENFEQFCANLKVYFT